jgi:hypothetical protein
MALGFRAHGSGCVNSPARLFFGLLARQVDPAMGAADCFE